MSKRNDVRSDSSLSRVGDHILGALTQGEIADLLDALFQVLSSDIRDKALGQLSPDTRQTVQNILYPPEPAGDTKTTEAKQASMAKLGQTWSDLWNEWYNMVEEAAQEEGEYIAQEVDWEPPYFDDNAFIEDLEKVAGKMRPLLQTAFQNGFSPDTGFAEELLGVEEEISGALPEWMGIVEGLYLKENLTTCLLEWEWLTAMDEEQDAFVFAQRILDWENQFSLVALEDDTFVDFFTQLSEGHQQAVLEGLTRHKDTSPWEKPLETVHSHWHALYMYYVDQYAPERYLDNLRATIPQQWQNGLPVIEDLLAKKDYQESLAVIEETLDALLKFYRGTSWSPETSLLCTIVRGFHYGDDTLANEKSLLQYYQQAVRELGQSQRVNTLEIQIRAFDHFSDWEIMFKAFEEVPVPEKIRQALFQSWRDDIIQRARPGSWAFGSAETSEPWWLHWLIESISDTQKGPSWLQKKIAQWLEHLPGERPALGEDYAFLRLLTNDLMEMDDRTKNRYPRFRQVVLRPKELSTPDSASRQEYLKQYAPDDLLDRIMTYWKEHLQNFVPRPEMAEKSIYTEHARWMAALKELAPRSYEALLDKWRVDHRRRRNLWAAMEEMGLG